MVSINSRLSVENVVTPPVTPAAYPPTQQHYHHANLHLQIQPIIFYQHQETGDTPETASVPEVQDLQQRFFYQTSQLVEHSYTHVRTSPKTAEAGTQCELINLNTMRVEYREREPKEDNLCTYWLMTPEKLPFGFWSAATNPKGHLIMPKSLFWCC